MYHTGEFIVYGTSGVCEVTAVGQPAFARDEGRLYYTLTPVYGTETIYIPVDSPVFMRPVISREQAEALIESIPGAEAMWTLMDGTEEMTEGFRDLIELAASR